jgi:hypothetical protein
VRCFIFHNLATIEDRGMQICILILKGNKIMEPKAPNLGGLFQTLASLWGALSPSCTSHSQEAMRGAMMKTKHFFVMRKDTIAHECVDPRVCGLSPRGASKPWLNRPTLKMEKCK